MRASIILLSLCQLLASSVGATIIGHANVDGVADLPQATMDAIGQQRWLFTHASVGANIIDGMTSLRSQAPGRYQLTVATAGDWSQIYPPPAQTVPGTVYDGVRGNPGWSAKFAMFDDAVRDLGWRHPLIDAAMDKLCYIDQSADVSVYLATMTALEVDFPATRFVYVTMPLQSGDNMNWANILATAYNEAVRAHCAAGDRLLYDLADIECHDPAGNHITFTYQGQVYERLYSGYTNDGGHLNSAGARRAAQGWYATAAAMLGGATPAPVPAPGSAICAAAPNPFNPATVIRYRLEREARVELAVFDGRGHRVACLVDGVVSAGEQAAPWQAAGQAAGVYLARLAVDGRVCGTHKLTLVP